MEFSRVSRLFHSLMQEECLWKRICVEEFKIKPDITWRKQSWKKLYISLRNPKIYTFSYDLYYDEDSTNMRSERLPDGNYEVQYFTGKGITDISYANKHIHGLDRQGRLWIWKVKANGSPSKSVTVPEKLQQVRFMSLSSFEHHLVGLARDGTVWYYSSLSRARKVVKIVGFRSKVIQVTCQNAHCSFLTEDGAVWLTQFPQFITETDNELEAIFGVKWEEAIIQLANLQKHTLALTQSGRVLLMDTENPIVFAAYPDNFIEVLICLGEHPVRSIGRYDFGFAVYTEEGEVFYSELEVDDFSVPWRGLHLKDKSEGQLLPCLNTCSFLDFYVAVMPKGELEFIDKQIPFPVQWLHSKYVLSLYDIKGQCSMVAIDKR